MCHALLIFKVLINFPAQYLFAIARIYSLRWSLPPALGFNPKTLNLFAARPAPRPRWRSGKVRDCHAIGRGFDPRSVQQIFVSLFLFFFLYCCRARSLRPSSRSHRRRHRACLDQLLQTGSVPEGFSPRQRKKNTFYAGRDRDDPTGWPSTASDAKIERQRHTISRRLFERYANRNAIRQDRTVAPPFSTDTTGLRARFRKNHRPNVGIT